MGSSLAQGGNLSVSRRQGTKPVRGDKFPPPYRVIRVGGVEREWKQQGGRYDQRHRAILAQGRSPAVLPSPWLFLAFPPTTPF